MLYHQLFCVWRLATRFFVATNQANSYAVYYFEREDQSDRPSKRKGEIFMSGYSVRSVKREEEIPELGDHAIVLEVLCCHLWMPRRAISCLEFIVCCCH